MSNLSLSSRYRLVGLSCVFAILPFSGVLAQASSECEQAVADGQARYEEGQYDEVISTLSACFYRDDVLVANVVAAYRLVALAHIRKGEVEEARLAIIQLLNRMPEYEPDRIRDIPSYVALVNIIKQDLGLDQDPALAAGEPALSGEPEAPPRSWFQSNRGWLLVGGSAALTGVILIIASGGGGSTGTTSSLPLPPALPN